MWHKGFLIVEFIVTFVIAHAVGGWPPPRDYTECSLYGGQCLATVPQEMNKCQVTGPYSCGGGLGATCCLQLKVPQPEYLDQCTSNGGTCQVFTGYGSKCDIVELPYRCSDPGSMCCYQPNPYPYPNPYQPPNPYPIYPEPQIAPQVTPLGSVGSAKPRRA